MLNDSSLVLKLIALTLNFVFFFKNVQSAVAPILDIENESIGYTGSIGERNVLVDLKPHLQIRNIEAINGICSYHVFKPTSEEFPFTIDIKDKITGEAVIEVIRKEVDSVIATDEKKQKLIFLDCNKRKEYDFLIQAHDCSSPSLPSNKVPVKISVIDHDDYTPKFEQADAIYKKTLVESDDLYENFMTIRAKDSDCTNNGFACTYQLLTKQLSLVDAQFPFKIDNTGLLSSLRSVKKGEFFEFVVRAFDCLNNQSTVDAQVFVNVIEPCVPQWTDYPAEILSTLEKTNLFDTLKMMSCDQQNENLVQKQETVCKIESVQSVLNLNLDESIRNSCQQCDPIKIPETSTVSVPKTSKQVLFTGGAVKAVSDDDDDDDSIEDDDDLADENRVVPSIAKDKDTKEPLNFRSFSKVIENALKLDFEGKFGNEFVLSVWLRRPANADKTIKEQVICGTDSKSMNRHHFGLYFYRGNLKFLLRREPSQNQEEHKDTNDLDSSNIDSNEAFYPSLWEWSLYDPVLTDSKWHFYEIKYNYPNVSLYIDGVRFVENTTNSDIIDAYELNNVNEVGPITTYVGACFHARTQALTDHFEGDIGDIVLTKMGDGGSKAVVVTDSAIQQVKCKTNCDELIDLDLSGDERLKKFVESSNINEISLKTMNLDEMADVVRKLSYVNKETYPQLGQRSVKLRTSLQCGNTGKQIHMNEITVGVNMKRHSKEYKVILEGDKQLFVSKLDLENGIEPFKDISISKLAIDTNNNIEDSSEDDSGETSSEADSDSGLKLSKCLIQISPERNLIMPALNNEKVMFLQNLLDEFGFKFEETSNTVLITGEQEMDNYETFIRRLTYVIININEVEPASKLELIKNKKFHVSCTRAQSNTETNSILVQVNLTKNEKETALNDRAKLVPGLIAHKQIQKYVVSENDDDIVQKKSPEFSALSSNNSASNPMVVALLVMASCAIGFLLVFGAIKMYTSKAFGQKRKALPNEENPQMEWDDSGLNITENPLETFENNKENALNGHASQNVEYECEEYSSSDEEEEGFNDDEQFSSEEEPEKIVDRELEWDDTSLEIKIRDKQLKQQQQLAKNLSNKTASNFVDPNKFV